MQVEYSPSGIYLNDLDLWLDPQQPAARAWLSHAHSDHARGVHELAFGTEATLNLYQDRWPDQNLRRRLHPVTPGEPVEFQGARLTAYPAGHILGAAQLLVEYNGERLVYTGDIKLRPPICGWTTEPVPCDHLIIESTFGLPIFHFLTREQAAERIIRFARECLADGEIPAFLGYPLGRGQEIVHVLCSAGIPVAVHGAIARYIPHYERAGFAFPGWKPYGGRKLDGRAFVTTPGLRAHLEAGGKARIAYVSGWAMFDSARTRSSADQLIPYSDHADFEELLELVAGTEASRVDVVHGYAEPFAGFLRGRGIDARAFGDRGAASLQEEVEG